tara:strand:- start:2033 stop:2221 length:189 start_codon:yes stop_codon:yes gene_type:complete
MNENEMKKKIEMLEGELDNIYQNIRDDRKLYVSDLMEIRKLITEMLNQVGYNPDEIDETESW